MNFVGCAEKSEMNALLCGFTSFFQTPAKVAQIQAVLKN